MDPYVSPDPVMPPPPHNRDKKWIESYTHDSNQDQMQLNLLFEEEKNHQMQQSSNVAVSSTPPLLLPSYNATKPFPVVLPDFDPSLLTPIGPYQRADWNETHPKAKVGVSMKRQREYEYVFLRDKRDKAECNSNGSYSDTKPQRIIH
eukprot:1362024-Ditylum_brightwellii.AAC.1